MNQRVRVNGADRTLDATTIGELLCLEGVDAEARFVAVALNGAVVPRHEWPWHESPPATISRSSSRYPAVKGIRKARNGLRACRIN